MAIGDSVGTLTGSATSISTSLAISTGGPVAVTAGDLIYAALAEQASITSTVCNDNLGNVYTACNAGTDSGTIVTGRAWWARANSTASLTSVTFTANGGTSDAAALAAVIAGPFMNPPLDTNVANVTNDVTTPFACPSSGTLVQASEVVMCWIAVDAAPTLTATSPNLKVAQASSASVITMGIGRQLAAATTAVAPAWTSTLTPNQSALGTTTFRVGTLFLIDGAFDQTHRAADQLAVLNTIVAVYK